MSMRTGELDAVLGFGATLDAAERMAAEEQLLGKRGIPSEAPWDDGPMIDALGRVNGQTYPAQSNLFDDDIPDFLKAPAMKKAPENVQEHQPPAEGKLDRKVTILKDHSLSYPALCLSIFVQGDWDVPDDEARFAKIFSRAGCKRAPSVLEADLVIFGGGSDVDPALYGAKRHDTTFFNSARDSSDIDLYLLCVEHGIPMLGICRGAQFLHVMNGGVLYQDVDGHMGPHSMYDVVNNQHIDKISSVHHQMVVENVQGGMQIIGTSAKSNERALDNNNIKVGTNADIEAFFYRDTCCLGIQGHPEYEGYPFFTKWCLELIESFVYCNNDLEWVDGSSSVLRILRLKEELRAVQKDIPIPDNTLKMYQGNAKESN